MNNWYKFLLTEDRNFLISNIMKIYEALANVPTQNATAEILDTVPPPSFLDFLKDNNLINIFKTYEIDGLLGHGIKGLAFALKDPHENYVLKFEMHYHNQSKSKTFGFGPPNSSGGFMQSSAVPKRPGVDYPQQIAAKQERGEYDPKQVHVLESEVVEGEMIDTESHAEGIDFYLSVMSRVQTSTYKGKGTGGMSIKDAMQDFAFSKAPVFISMAIEKTSHTNPDLKNWIRSELQFSKFGTKLPRDNRDILSKITDVLYDKILIQDGKGIANFLYNTFQDQFQYLSKEQFVDLCREFYERLADAKRSGKAFADFHGGNVGVGPKGFASFDV